MEANQPVKLVLKGSVGSIPMNGTIRDHSSIGRALPLQSKGYEFDSHWLHKLSVNI